MSAIWRIIKGFLVFNELYFLGLLGTEVISGVASPKITSKSQLEQVIEIERKKIDYTNDCKIFSHLLKDDKALSAKIGNKTYSILIGGNGANESVVRHELYHILSGDFENNHIRIII